MDAPALHPKLSATLDAFRAGGVLLSDEEIVWLAALRRPCDHPSDGLLPWPVGAPLKYAGVDWYPMHRLAESWMIRSFKLLESTPSDQVYAFMFAHAHSKPGDTTLRELVSTDAMREAVRAWSDSLALHDDQLNTLCDKLRELDGSEDTIPDPDKKADEAKDTPDNSAQFVAMMCRAFPGCTPEYWMVGISAKDARNMITSDSAPDFVDSFDRTEAIRNYLKAVRWIWINHNG